MAENEDGQEKSFEPTERKKEQAREEGKVVTSKEMFVFVSLAMGTLMITLLQGTLRDVSGHWAGYMRIPDGADLDSLIMANISQAWTDLLVAGLIVSVPVAIAIILLQMAMGGINFAPKAAGFKGEKINPLAGIKRMFSKQALVDLVKSVLKVLFLGIVAAIVLQTMLPEIDRMWASDAGAATASLIRYSAILMAALTVVLALIGALDLGWQMYSLRESLMMTFKEVKDENKETNGSPEIKGKLRQLQYEASRRAAKERAALTDVPQATAIVTNPTHFAVAMRYVPGEMEAPVVLASGKGHMAREIIRIGASSGINNVRIPLLARALYFTTDIGMQIDERLYTAVASLLGYVYQLDRGFAVDVPDIDLPPELCLNEFGKPLGEGEDDGT